MQPRATNTIHPNTLKDDRSKNESFIYLKNFFILSTNREIIYPTDNQHKTKNNIIIIIQSLLPLLLLNIRVYTKIQTKICTAAVTFSHIITNN